MVETSAARPLRIVLWTTGNVGREACAEIMSRPDLELAGVFATADVDALLALRPDCVLFVALRMDMSQVAQILSAGINVVTTSEFMTGYGIGPEATSTLRAAALARGSTLFGTGVNPGFAELFAGVCAGISRDVRSIALTEFADVAMFASDPNFAAVG